MSRQALARQWRPKSFADVVGQDTVVRALSNALSQQRLHHAYLFTGTRGVGKTTLARIFAKALNCEQGVSPTPCQVCSACQEIDQGRYLDVIEVDAASRTKVEDTRELLENVSYQTVKGRYKVYLIDEVHMLSQHSFNALLKTLEEPPDHVKFLFATTDPEKIPATVLSRCLRFQLRPISQECIVTQCASILEAEDITFDSQALHQLAYAGLGSLRDALSLLDQLIALNPKHLDQANVQQLLGTLSQGQLLSLMEACLKDDPKTLINTIDQCLQSGAQPRQALSQLAEAIHALRIAQALQAPPQHPLLPTDWLSDQLSSISSHTLHSIYQSLLNHYDQIDLHPNPRIGLHMALLDVLSHHQAASATPFPSETPATRPSQAPSKPTPPPVQSPPKRPAPNAPKPTTPPQEKGKTPPLEAQHWAQVVSFLALTGMTKAVAQHSAWVDFQSPILTIGLLSTHMPMVSEKHRTRIEEALRNRYQPDLVLRIQPLTAPEQPTVQETLQHESQRRQSELESRVDQQDVIQFAKRELQAKITRVEPLPDSTRVSSPRELE